MIEIITYASIIIFAFIIFYYKSKGEKKQRDEDYNAYNPVEFFDNDDIDVSEYLTTDIRNMRLYKKVEYDLSSGTGYVLIDEYLMKEDDNKKILIKEVCRKYENHNYGKVSIETSLPHELIFEKYAKLSFKNEENPILTDEEKEKFEEYKTNFSPDDLNEKLRKKYDKELERVGNWNPIPKDWDYMVTKMFVDIRSYEKDGKYKRTLEDLIKHESWKNEVTSKGVTDNR